MNQFLKFLLICCFCCLTQAAPLTNTTLRVGIVPSTEPFIMQASSNEYYGFDISTVNYICSYLKKTCKLIPINRTNLDNSINRDQVDLIIGDIVINAQMQQRFEFTMPYMTSQAQFVGPQKIANQPFNQDLLKNMKIGVIANSAYAIAIQNMNFPCQIKLFESDSEIISAIGSKQIDIGFINSYIAQYWQNNSNGVIYAIGNPVSIGFGLGLIINPQTTIVQDINLAIYNYQNSADFKQNYNMYLNGM